MDATISILGKPLRVHVSASAERQLARRREPMFAEMELYFSCLIRKQVRFGGAREGTDAVPVREGLHVRFRPVMTQRCSVSEGGSAPPLTEFPIVNARAYMPHWLRIDYRRGEWLCEFGFD